jgi:predicted glycosyltransferase
MKIFIDIGHPAHVHYFRNFVEIMEDRGHCFLITARDREHVFNLLEYYGIPFENRGEGGHSRLGKIWYLFVTVWRQYCRAKKFKPDFFLDFSTIYSGPAAWLLGKPYITFTDTETTGLYRIFIKPFCKAVYTPQCFNRNLGKIHHRFNGLMELCYLHPRYFEPDPSVLEKIGVKSNERFAIVRFVGWGAVHDHGKRGFSDKRKIQLIRDLQEYGRVFISAECDLPEELEPLRLQTKSHQIHHLLFYATLLVGEGATMATEAAILGTPAVYLSDFRLGNLLYLEEKYGMVLNFGTSEKEQSMALKSAALLLGRPGTKSNGARQAERILDDHIDVTQFMADTIEQIGISKSE